MELLTRTLPACIVSAVIFYFLSRPVFSAVFKKINTYNKVMFIIANILFYTIVLKIADRIDITKGYHAIILGIFIGIVISYIPIMIQSRNIQEK